MKSLSRVRLFATVDCSLPGSSSMEFSRLEYWSGLPFPSPQDLPDPGSNLGLPNCRQTLYHLSQQGSQQESVIHIHISTLFFFLRFFSHIGYYRVLSRVPCAIQQVLTSNLFYIFVPTCLVAQSCPTLCDPMNCSPPGSCVHGIS